MNTLSPRKFSSTPFLRAGIACAAVLATSLTSVSAATIVNWGDSDDMVAGTRGMAGQGLDTLDFTSFAAPSSGTEYAVYAATPGVTADFYASAFYTSDVTVGNQATGLRINNDNPDVLNFAVSEASATQTDNHAIMFWQDSEFLTGDRELESISVTTAINTGSADLYFVIRLGSNYYRSSAATSPGSVSLTDPSTTSWFDYDPLTDFSDLSGSLASLGSFDNLTGVGFYGHNDGGNFNQFKIQSVEVTAIPEPASAALFIGLGLYGLAAARRRSR